MPPLRSGRSHGRINEIPTVPIFCTAERDIPPGEWESRKYVRASDDWVEEASGNDSRLVFCPAVYPRFFFFLQKIPWVPVVLGSDKKGIDRLRAVDRPKRGVVRMTRHRRSQPNSQFR